MLRNVCSVKGITSRASSPLSVYLFRDQQKYGRRERRELRRRLEARDGLVTKRPHSLVALRVVKSIVMTVLSGDSRAYVYAR